MAEFNLFPSILPDGDDAVEEVSDDVNLEDAEAALDDGRCPFCESYDGDYPANHAPKAHPNRWEAFRQARDAADADAQTSAGSAIADGGDGGDG